MTDQFKAGNEFLPYHPQASHVDPQYRDGWNHCYLLATAEVASLEARLEQVGQAARDNRSRRVLELEAEVEALRKAATDARAAALAEAARLVPTNWIDPLLTGPDAVIGNGTADGRQIEALLRGIQDRIRALGATARGTSHG